MRFATTLLVLMPLLVCSACGTTSAPPVSARPDVPTVCMLPFPRVSEEVFLTMSETEQEDVLTRQGVWLNDCLAPGSDTPPSLD